MLKGRTPDQWTARQVAEQVRSPRGRWQQLGSSPYAMQQVQH